MDGTDFKVRFKDAEWVTEPKEIIVGGLGGIGNGLATELGKLGHCLHIYEFDKVEYQNCLTQGYMINQIGKTKFDAFVDNLSNQVDCFNAFHLGKLTSESMGGPIMFSCFDNMLARKEMFSLWRDLDTREVFIDGRLLAEVFQIFVVRPGQEEAYEEYLFDDSEVETEPCTYKQTSHIAKMLHGTIINYFCSWLVNQKYGAEVRPVPFFTEFIAPMNYWNYETVRDANLEPQAVPTTA